MDSPSLKLQKNEKNNDVTSKGQTINDLQDIIRNQAAEIQHLKSKLNNYIHTGNLPRAHNDCSITIDEDSNKFIDAENVKDFPILLDLCIQTANKSKNFSKETLQLSNDICFLSPRCHQLLIENCNFPSRYLLNKQFNNEFSELLTNFSDITKANNIIRLYKEKFNIHDVINATLSVDALFFHPIISLSDKLDFSGIEIPNKTQASLPHNLIELFQEDPEIFECFIEKTPHL